MRLERKQEGQEGQEGGKKELQEESQQEGGRLRSGPQVALLAVWVWESARCGRARLGAGVVRKLLPASRKRMMVA